MGWMDGRYSTYRDSKYIEVGTIDDVYAQLKEMVESARESRDRAREELVAIKEEAWKDEQLQKMKAEVEEMQWHGRHNWKWESGAPEAHSYCNDHKIDIDNGVFYTGATVLYDLDEMKAIPLFDRKFKDTVEC